MATTHEILAAADSALRAAIACHAHLHSDRTDAVPAGPDTSRFRATRSAMVEMRPDAVTYEGPSGMFRRTWTTAAAIGGLHPADLVRDVREEVVDATLEYTGTPMVRLHDGSVRFEAEDGAVIVASTYGTNYSVVGARTV